MAGLQHEGFDQIGSNWFSIRKEIEENSPSRRDGIDMKKEAYFRKSYCTFLQDLGMRLKVPQVTIASAIMFCHRFFLRQSHAKNDRMTVATVCMFLAGKVEETPRPLRDVILISYEIIHKKDSAAVHRIKQQRELYEQQKELILMGERLVLATLGFDLNMLHPYKPLVEAIKKFKVAQNALAQVAWNFVNDGLRTSLCLQFKPHHIAAGAIFLAAKFLKVKLPNDGDKFWWQEFDVTPRQLEDVSNQMLELYEQNRLATTNGSEVDGSDDAKNNHRSSGKKIASATEEQPTSSASGFSSQVIVSNPPNESSAARHCNETELLRNSVQNPTDSLSDHNEEDGANRGEIHVVKLEGNEKMIEGRPYLEAKEGKPAESLNGNSGSIPSTKTPGDVIAKIDKEKYKAALEKRRKNQSRGENFGKKPDVMDDYDFIERELENGVEMAERERKQLKSITASKTNSILANPLETDNNHAQQGFERSTDRGEGLRRGTLDRNDNVEDGELSLDAPPHPSREYQSPMSNSKKRKPEVSPFNRAVRTDHYHDREHSHRNYRQETRHA